MRYLKQGAGSTAPWCGFTSASQAGNISAHRHPRPPARLARPLGPRADIRITAFCLQNALTEPQITAFCLQKAATGIQSGPYSWVVVTAWCPRPYTTGMICAPSARAVATFAVKHRPARLRRVAPAAGRRPSRPASPARRALAQSRRAEAGSPCAARISVRPPGARQDLGAQEVHGEPVATGEGLCEVAASVRSRSDSIARQRPATQLSVRSVSCAITSGSSLRPRSPLAARRSRRWKPQLSGVDLDQLAVGPPATGSAGADRLASTSRTRLMRPRPVMRGSADASRPGRDRDVVTAS